MLRIATEHPQHGTQDRDNLLVNSLCLYAASKEFSPEDQAHRSWLCYISESVMSKTEGQKAHHDTTVLIDSPQTAHLEYTCPTYPAMDKGIGQKHACLSRVALPYIQTDFPFFLPNIAWPTFERRFICSSRYRAYNFASDSGMYVCVVERRSLSLLAVVELG